MGLLPELGSYLGEFSYQRLSAPEVAKVKNCLLDWMAVTLAGSTEETPRLLFDYLRAAAVPGPALVLSSGEDAGGLLPRTSPAMAALVNATTGHVLDFDDVTTLGSGHPSAPVIPAVLALAEREGASGREVLAGVAAGITIGLALGLPIMPGHYRRGFHNTATLGRLGAAAGAGVLLGFTPERHRAALAMATATAGGLRSSFGTMLKSVQVGWAAMGGVMAAELAGAGITGPEESILGEGSLYAAMAPATDQAALEALQAGLEGRGDVGLSQSMLDSVRLKAFPACLSTHGAIIAALRARPALPTGATIVEIVCRVHPLCLEIAADPSPSTGLAAKFSVQYCVALALTDGAVNLESFTDRSAARPAVRELAGKVRVVGVDDYTRDRECDLSFEFAGAAPLSVHTRLFEPMTAQEEWAEARAKLAQVLPRASGLAERVAEQILHLDEVDDVREVTALLARPED